MYWCSPVIKSRLKRQKKFCLLCNSTGISIWDKRSEIFVCARPVTRQGGLITVMCTYFLFSRTVIRKIHLCAAPLGGICLCPSAMRDSRVFRGKQSTWDYFEGGRKDVRLQSRAHLMDPREVFSSKGPLFLPRRSRQWSPAEWILVPCAQQAPVTTKPLIISWQKPKGIILLSSVLCR